MAERQGTGRVQLEPGTRVGRFDIERELGSGGMGVVYLARDSQLDRRVALKLLYGAPNETTDTAQTRMVREAQAMARLNHPNVVRIYEVGTHAGIVFIAMELVEGTTLKGWLKQPRSWQDIVRTMRAAGAGLAAAHDAGVVHRDFKPDNVLIGNDGRVYVSDFGLARGIDETSDSQPVMLAPSAPVSPTTDALASPITQAGMLVGTPGYMAPEQVSGLSTNERTDQFSFAVVLYEALYGQRPFKASALDGPVPPPPSDTLVPPWLQRTIERGLSRNRADRFDTMHALLAALVEPAPRRRRAPWIALGACVLLVSAFVGMRLRHRSPCDAPERSLDGVWDAAVKAQLGAAFAKSGAEAATARWQFSERALDGYAGRLIGAYRDACIATSGEHTKANVARELRLQCLDQKRERVQVITDVLAHNDKAMIAVAPAIAQLTEPESECADATVLALAPKLPATPAQLAELRRRFVRTQAKEAINSTQAIDDYKALIADLERVGDKPLLAKVLANYARTYSRKGRYQEALELNRRARDLADETHHDVEASVYASSVLANTALLGRPRTEIDALIEPTRSRLLRTNNSPTAEMAFEDAIAVVCQTSGRTAEAITHTERALALSRQLHVATRSIALRLNNLGAEYESAGRYDETLRAQHEALQLLSSMPDAAADGMRWMMLTNLVWGESGLGQNKDARRLAEEVAQLAHEHGELIYSAICESFLANLLIADGEKDAGERMAKRALDALHQLKLESAPDALEVYHQAARAYDSLGRKHDAEAMVRALFDTASAKIPADSDAWVPFLRVGGIVALHAGDAATARRRFERALILSKGRFFYPGWIAEVRFRLAQLVWSEDKARARELADAAAAELDKVPMRKDLADELAAWRASHA